MFADAKYALRQLKKSPGFTVTTVLTLALGIGVNAVVFSVLNALILKPLNVPHPQNLYTVQHFRFPSQSLPDFRDLRDRNHTFASMFSYNVMGPAGLETNGGTPMTVWPYETSGNYFDALEIQPYLGRFFHASDERGANSAPYVVLSYALWHTQFHDDRSVVGRAIQLNKHPYTILGVAPPAFLGTELFFVPALWVPVVEQQQLEGYSALEERGNHSSFAGGRLKPGVTPQQATEDLNTIGAWLAKTYPREDDGVTFSLARPGLIGDMLGGPARAFMAALMVLAGLILLAACANLGSLFAARTADRGKEIAVRMALGSRRRLIVRQLLTETVLVSLIGGALGLAGGIAILRWISAWRPMPNIPMHLPVNPDVWTWVVALALAVASGILFGIVPLRQVVKADPWQTIRAGGSAMVHLGRFTLRDVLLVVQIAICAVLVTSSLVAVRGLMRSVHSQFGFQPDHVMLVSTDVKWAGYTGDQAVALQKRMLETAQGIPGVTAAGYSNNVPLSLGSGDSFVYSDATTDFRPTNFAADAMTYSVSPGYFAAAGTTLLAGRDISWHDEKNAPVVAVVNREFARKVFGSAEKAVGGYFRFWGGVRAQVVGVVENGKYRFLAEDQQPAMFFPILQHESSALFLVVRSNRDPQEIAGALQRNLRALDPLLPLTIGTWRHELESALFAPRVASVALGVLGLLGAMLAVTGIFGMASYVVSKRMRELGIRVALGARQNEILRAALGRAFVLLAAGSVAGIVLGVLATKVLSYIVYQATPKDPVVLGGVVAAMLVVGLVAAWIPAQRALAVDPMILLRDE
ncbi:MAG TPA: ABC transporter permease [Acidobacteriaceae bacterium]|nr:ABC transporter permease [Acidobacteriaceae bacterium]